MLEAFLTANIFHYLLVFTRLASLMMMLPGIASTFINRNARLALGAGLAIIVTPTVQHLLPGQPDSAAGLFKIIFSEIVIGFFLGAVIQTLMAALHLAGTTIGYTSGMANAMVFDPISEQQGAMVIGLLGNTAVLLIFATGLHHTMILAGVQSYTLFPPGNFLPIGDFASIVQNTLSESFEIGMRLSAPFVVYSLVFYTGIGLLNRLSPSMNVFFVSLPLQLLSSLALLSITLPAIMLWFLKYFEDGLMNYVVGGP